MPLENAYSMLILIMGRHVNVMNIGLGISVQFMLDSVLICTANSVKTVLITVSNASIKLFQLFQLIRTPSSDIV